MTPLSAPTAPGITAAAPGAVHGQPGDSAETVDFEAILAGETPSPPADSITDAPAALSPGQSAKLEKAVLGILPEVAALPEGGKILPDHLPDHVPAGVPAALKASMRLQGGQASEHAAEAAYRVKATTSTHDDAGEEPTVSALPAEAAVMPVLALAPARPMDTPPSAQQAGAAAAPTGSQAPQALPLPRPTPPLTQRADAAQHGTSHPQMSVLQLDRVTAQEAAPAAAAIVAGRPAGAPELTVPTADTSVTARLKLNPGAVPVRESETPDNESLISLFAAPAQTNAPAAPTGIGPAAAVAHAGQPHDFAALVDSIVAAREAARPHAVSISLATAEFGAVRLRFNHDDAGLSVTMASADPEFARAASAAMPVPPPPASADAQGQQNAAPQQRQPGQPGTAGNGSSQSGNGSAQQQQSRPAAQGNPSPRSAGSETGSARTGIFA